MFDYLPFRNSRLSQRDSEDHGTVQVDAQGVSFKKQNNVPNPSQIDTTSPNIRDLEETISRLTGKSWYDFYKTSFTTSFFFKKILRNEEK